MNVVRWTLRALLSHWRRHPVQFFSLFTGLWLATALLTGVQAINGQARESYARASGLIGGAPHASLQPVDGQPLPQAAFSALRRQGWPVSPVLEGAVQLADGSGRLRIMGIEPLSLPSGSRIAGAPAAVEGLIDFISPPGQGWIAAQTLAARGWREGATPALANGERLPPLQVREGMAPGVVMVDIGVAQRVLQQPGEVGRLLLPAGAEATLPPPWDARLRRDDGDGNGLDGLTDSFHLNLTALGLLAFAVGLFIVHAAIGLALEQRRPLLRTLRASGVGVRALLLALAIELGALALLGGAAGVASGYLLASLLLPDVAASLRGLYGAEIGGQLTLSPAWWLSGLGLALMGALLAGAGSLWRAARLPLLAVAGGEAWMQAHRLWLRRQGVAAAVAIAVALAAWRWGGSLVSGFVMLGGMLLGAALALPLLLSGGLRLIPTAGRSPLAGWFIADARQQLPALSLALMALLLALAANIGAGSMTEGFRQTFTGWLDQRLAAELYVRPADDAQARALQAWLARQPEVQRQVAVRGLDVEVAGHLVELTGIADDPLYRAHWPLLQSVDRPWDALFGGDALMLSEQLARRLGVGLGDAVALPAAGAPWRPRVVAIYADYGNPRGHVLVPGGELLRHWPAAPVESVAVRVAPDRVDALAARLQERFALGSDRVVDQARLKGWASQVFERTFSATAALNSLTLGVAGVALFIALLTQGQGRLGQLAPLWATGVGRARLMQLNAAQAWLLSGLTLLLALPLGILLAWALVAVINVQAFGWRLPLQVFPGQLLQLAGWAAAATALASAWPLFKLWRSRPVDLLGAFADER
ncbi:ABC transporter permease [Luteimonas sp. RD2P54]|uniref:ABC transporter permease n=1 Tax=Luteimonas endophytica TaxID=3042023 RepID=A0ABT6J4I2_9GAMM|nr:FtsX-like permease family protein [Luteimonas endophytica]MDH5821731.1 ABC transporter permease [Luteimonas endophytica]